MGKRWWNRGWPPVAATVLLLLAWQAAVAWGHIETWILPSPSQIFQEGIHIFPRVWEHTWATLQIALLGFFCGVMFGLAIAVALHLIPGFRAALSPLLVLSQNVPIIVMAPLLFIWFGYGLLPKMIVIVLVCFFPVAVALLSGFVQADRTMMQYLQMIGAGRSQIFMKLEFPNALPYFFSGLKISAVYCVMGAVVAEWIGAEKGIGQFLIISFKNFMTVRVFVAIFVIVLLSLALFGVVSLLEKLLIRWNAKEVR